MLRTRQHKYVALRGCQDLAFDRQVDPLEQENLLSPADTRGQGISVAGLRGDGLLVEADAPLYDPRVVSARTGADFDRQRLIAEY